jgi:protein SCO1
VSDYGGVHHLRSAKAALLIVVALLVPPVTGCGGDDAGTATSSETTTGSGGALTGLTRAEPLEVGTVTLPEVTLGTPEAPFAFRAAPGELLVAYFGYTSCPDVCPTTLANLRVAREEAGPAADRLDLAMVTVDPERDTPEVLSGYLSSFAERYHALRTTDPAALRAAEDAFGASSSVTTTPEGRVEVAHSGTAYVVDDQGRVLVEWPFGVTADAMASDLRILLEGSST